MKSHQNFLSLRLKKIAHTRVGFFCVSALLILSITASFFPLIATAATGVPKIINFQGRLLDSSGNLLGGSGTNYCFKFSLYDASTAGTKLWPSGSPSNMTLNVKTGVFNANIGSGTDTLDFDFQSNNTAYVDVQVAAQVASSCSGVTYETLTPRQQVVSAGYAINSGTVGGFTPAQSASGSQIPVLTSDTLVLGGTSVGLKATSTNALTFQSGVTGDIQFFSSSNKITSAGALTIAGLLTSTGLTTSGAAVSINNNSNFTTNINTGSANTLVSIGGGFGTFALDTTNIDISNAGVISGATGLTSSGAITFSGLSTTGIVHNSSGGVLSTSLVALGDLLTQGTATDEFCLTSETGGGALLEWQSCGGAGGGVTTMAAIGSVPNANGASISGTTLTLQPADGSFGGVVTTASQTFAGTKTFNNDAVVHTLTVGLGSGSVASNTVFGYEALNSSLAMNQSVAVGYQALKNAGQAIPMASMINGNEYVIQTTGTTTFTNCGAVSNSPGTVFTYNGNGVPASCTGTGTVSPTQGNNVAIGYQALLANTYGTENIGIGGAALTSNTGGYANIGIGNAALYNNTTGLNNVSLGASSSFSNSNGNNNSAFGTGAFSTNSSGSGNTAIGTGSLSSSTVSDNTALGYNAGSNLTAGSNNIFIGSGIQPNISNTASNQLNIGNWIYGDNGRIGIGIANPSSDTVLELHNNATDVAPQLTLSNENTGNSYAQLRLKGTCNISICTVDGYQGWSFGVGNETESYFGLARDFFIYDQAADAIRFTIKDTTGNVGIGDTSPASLFTVGSGDLFQVNSSGVIVAAAGITSSGTITFSGLGGGGTQCVQTSNTGVLSAAACGGGGSLQGAYDGGTPTIVTDASGDIIFSLIGGATDTQFEINAASAPEVDMVNLTNAGQAVVTAGVDGLAINFVTGDGTNFTNSAIDVTLTNGGTAAGDIIRGLTFNNITPTAATEVGLYVGTGYDSDIEFADLTPTMSVADNGTLTLSDGSSTSNDILNIGTLTSRGNALVYGNVELKGGTKQEAIAGVNDTFIYDTTRDSDGGAWTNSDLSQQLSWYTESKDDGAGDPCVTSSDDRCGKSVFPKKALLVASDTALYIFDADTKTLWMKFTQSSTATLGADTNNNPSSVFALNGVVYVGTTGSSATGMYAIDFNKDRLFRYNTTNRSQGDLAIGSRNSTVTYATDSVTLLQINSNAVNDVHATVVSGGSNLITVTGTGGPLQGQTFIAAATDDGISVINPQAKITWDYGNGAITDNYNAVYLTKRGRMYGLNATDSELDRWGIVTSGQYPDTANANVTAVTRVFDESTSPARLSKTTPTIATGAPDALEVVERASLSEIDPPATAGNGDVIYVGHSLGMTEIHDTNTVASATVQAWSKFYTKDYETPYMPASVKHAFTFEEASGDIVDKTFSADSLQPFGSPTYLADGVHNTAVSLNGTSQFFCNDTSTNDGTCDTDADWNTAATGFSIQLWFKHSTTITGTDALFDKCWTPATPTAAVGCTSIWMDASGLMNFGTDDDATWTTFATDDVATSVAGRSYADGQWHFLVANRANGATGIMSLFIDGQIVGGRTIAGGGLTLDASQAVIIGATCAGANCATGANFWDGSIDDFVMSNATGDTTQDQLTQAQVRRMYLEGYNAMRRKTVFVTNAGAATSTSLDVTSGTPWVPNELVGEIVEITGGSDSDCTGLTRTIFSNDNNTINFSAVPGNCTLDTTTDYEINPEVLYGASNVVKAVAMGDGFIGKERKLYVGTSDGSDGGGVTVFGGTGTAVASAVYHGGSGDTDSLGNAWGTSTDYDDIQSIDAKAGTVLIGSLAKIWTESEDRDINQTIDTINNTFETLRLELVGDNAGAASFEIGGLGGADLAEYYYSNTSLEAGDVVAIQPDQPAGIGKSESRYQKNLLGVVSTNPGLTLGPVAENAYPIALSGRIPVKITNENGAIHVGDLLTSSSRPGYAMRATGAGAVIGRVLNEPEAMTSCDAALPNIDSAVGDGPGVTGEQQSSEEGVVPEEETPAPVVSTSGEKCGYAMLFAGLGESLGKNIETLAKEFGDLHAGEATIEGITTTLGTQASIMAFLRASKADLIEKAVVPESIFTDRIAAGLEILTPTLYADDIYTKTITALDEGNISLILGENGKFEVKKDAAGTAVITLDSLGNAVFSGKVTAAEIDAAKITGFDALIARMTALETILQANAFDSLTSVTTQNLKATGDSSFDGKAQFAGLSFFANTTTFDGSVVFGAPTEFSLPPIFNKDTAGFAVIKMGARKVDVVFEKPYIAQPVTSASLSLEDIIVPATEVTPESIQALSDADAQAFLDQGISYIITNKTARGFTIRINKDAPRDIRFSWTAFASKDPAIFESVMSGLIVQPTPPTEETPPPPEESPAHEGDTPPDDDPADTPGEDIVTGDTVDTVTDSSTVSTPAPEVSPEPEVAPTQEPTF